MKKSVIIITALTYLFAIVLVAILGFVAETKNPPIYAEDIVMVFDDQPNFPEQDYEYYSNGALIYTISYNAEYDNEAEDMQKYKYNLRFASDEAYEFFQTTEGSLQLKTIAYSSQGNVDNPTLSYYMDKDKAEYVKVDKEGKLEFLTTAELGFYEVRVSTTDSSNITIWISIYW